MATPPEHVTIPSRDGLELSTLVLAPAPPGTVTSRGQSLPGVVVLHGIGSRK